MNTYSKYCPGVFVAKCSEEHEKGDVVTLTTRYGKEDDVIIYNLVKKDKEGNFYYSFVREDGFNVQERAKRKAERLEERADKKYKKGTEYLEKTEKHSDFLSLHEPVKAGHHSEKRHRRILSDFSNNMDKMCEETRKAKDLYGKAEYWRSQENKIDLSMPESLEMYKAKYEDAKEYHEGLKSGKYPREHSYSLEYANKKKNDMKKKYELAKTLWA